MFPGWMGDGTTLKALQGDSCTDSPRQDVLTRNQQRYSYPI